MRIDHYVHLAGATSWLSEMDALRGTLDQVRAGQEQIMATLNDVNAQLAALATAVQALIAKVQTGAASPADLDAVVAQAKSLTDQANAAAGVTG